MQVSETSLPGPLLLRPRRFGDARGWFSESWNARTLQGVGITTEFVQDNFAFSAKAGTLRGLHFQAPPSAQAKLIQVIRGAVLDVIVDLRPASATFGRHDAVTLTAEGGEQLLVPEGFAHGYCTIEDDSLVFYKVNRYYDPATDRGLLWNDPELGIAWPFGEDRLTLSDRDRLHPRLADLPAFDWSATS